MHSTSDNQMIYIAGVEEGKIVPFGFRLAKQGYMVFCPQCFLWRDKGELDYEQVSPSLYEKASGIKGYGEDAF